MQEFIPANLLTFPRQPGVVSATERALIDGPFRDASAFRRKQARTCYRSHSPSLATPVPRMELSLIRANYSLLNIGAGLPHVSSVKNHSTVCKIEHHMNMLRDLFQQESGNPFSLPLWQITPFGEKLRRRITLPLPSRPQPLNVNAHSFTRNPL